MKVIGFTNHFYTLWNVYESERYCAERKVTFIVTSFNYQKNLSHDVDQAREKVREMVGEDGIFEEDFSLRGQHGKYFTKTRIKDLELPCPGLGKEAAVFFSTKIQNTSGHGEINIRQGINGNCCLSIRFYAINQKSKS